MISVKKLPWHLYPHNHGQNNIETGMTTSVIKLTILPPSGKKAVY